MDLGNRVLVLLTMKIITVSQAEINAEDVDVLCDLVMVVILLRLPLLHPLDRLEVVNCAVSNLYSEGRTTHELGASGS